MWDKHRLPIGIFTMQGFEKRNAESKQIFRVHHNHRFNTCVAILQRLLGQFLFE
jgi:hypothetical protein